MDKPWATAKYHRDFRNWYRMPCCDVDVGILDDAQGVTCPACEAGLLQEGETITVVRLAQ